MDTIFGFPARLTVEVDGEEVDVTDAIKLVSYPESPRIEVDPDTLLRLVSLEREVRRRVACL